MHIVSNRRYPYVKILLSLLLVFLSNQAFCEIDKTILSAIKTAYTNGYVTAVRTDSESLEEMKEDEELLKKTVQESASDYASVVENMNRPKKTEEKAGNKKLIWGKKK